MKIEATVQEIRALVQLAELDRQAPGLRSQELRPGRRAARGPRVSEALMERYQTLLEVGRIPALVAIEHGGCSGCHVRLPTLVEQRAKRAPAIYNCPHCHRMLYRPEWLAAEGETETVAGGPGRASR